jgi:hypothetical protein
MDIEVVLFAVVAFFAVVLCVRAIRWARTHPPPELKLIRGPVAIPCPICRERPITVLKKAWYLEGYVVYIRYGSRSLIGCTECVNRELWESFWRTVMRGWWSYLFFLTPLVLLQNVIQIRLPDEKFSADLTYHLRQAGVSLDDVELGERVQ